MISSKNRREGIFSNSFYETSITLMPKPDKNRKKKTPLSHELKHTNNQQNIVNQIQQRIKRIIQHD